MDRLYHAVPSAADRDEHLFGRYEALADPLARRAGKQNRRVNRAAARNLKEPGTTALQSDTLDQD